MGNDPSKLLNTDTLVGVSNWLDGEDSPTVC